MVRTSGRTFVGILLALLLFELDSRDREDPMAVAFPGFRRSQLPYSVWVPLAGESAHGVVAGALGAMG